MAGTSHSVTVNVCSRSSEYNTSINCAVLPRITSQLPAQYIDIQEWNIPREIMLADPTFNRPGKIDLLIGAEEFFQVLLPETIRNDYRQPTFQNTKFGWILAGRASTSAPPRGRMLTQQSFFVRNDDGLDTLLQKFWEIETIIQPPTTTEEIECEKHFKANTCRDETGRFMVRLPLKRDPICLGDSRQAAISRFEQLEKRLMRNHDLQSEYIKVLKEYEELGHMRLVKDEFNTDNTYYLPHHAVLKETSSTTKLRVVFDASNKTTTGTSLNDILMIGPTVQQDLYSIILRFRTHQYVFTADIARMYRQINVDPDDVRLQRIFWRTASTLPLQCYELTTVTFGTASAPFLATRCLKELANVGMQTHPRAAAVLERDCYVDDLLSGCNKLEDALEIQSEIIDLLKSARFPLRKWCANHVALIEAVPPDCRETQLPLRFDCTDNVRTLGVMWHPTSDRFLIANKKIVEVATWTKRKITAVVASIFDPLGLVSPIVITYKVFLQQLWLHNLHWDAIIPPELSTTWINMYQRIHLLNSIEIDRLVLCTGTPTNIQIHGFCDSSELAYGACLYVRSVNSEGETTVQLLCSKSRVAPVKKITLPRLELCGAVLLAQLIDKTLPILNLKIESVYLWTDSSIVLAWISSIPSRWKTFVGNRVSQIQELTTEGTWRHVPSEQNPADLITRGFPPNLLQQHSFWWHRPHWLQETEDRWPSLPASSVNASDPPEQRPAVKTFVTQTVVQTSDALICKYSTLSKLVRVVAYCKRFCHNAKIKNMNKINGVLSVMELEGALITCVKIGQRVGYPSEIRDLESRMLVSRKSKLCNLHPFLDNEGMLRVGGRLENSSLPYDSKHQMILPRQHHFVKLLIMSEHLKMLHASQQLLMTKIRQRFWIPRLKDTIRSVLHTCLRCYTLKATAAQQLMGSLPACRVQPARPFLNSGVDYCGPVFLKQGSMRSKGKVKAYIAIFVCLATKAAHIELVSDLSTEAFLAALRRLMARRGKCSHLYSDNGTNFVGAARQLRELRDFLKAASNKRVIEEMAAAEGCTWHFIPPSSPSFGGLWEATVKSAKYHLKRQIGDASLTFELMTTLLTQIEACLNSRPLTALTSESPHTSYLTPGHFLIGEPLTSFPEPTLSDLKINRLDRWQRVQQMVQRFWKQWSAEYLNTLQQRSKWTTEQRNLQPGDLVLLKEANSPPLQWSRAVIQETHPGKDNLVRVVTLKTSKGTFKRPISKIVPLPYD